MRLHLNAAERRIEETTPGGHARTVAGIPAGMTVEEAAGRLTYARHSGDLPPTRVPDAYAARRAYVARVLATGGES